MPEPKVSKVGDTVVTPIQDANTEIKQAPDRAWNKFSPKENIEYVHKNKQLYPTENLPDVADAINKMDYPLKAMSKAENGTNTFGFYREVAQPSKGWNASMNNPDGTKGGYQYGLTFKDGGFRVIPKQDYTEYVSNWRTHQEEKKPYYVPVYDTDNAYSNIKLEKGVAKGKDINVEVEKDEIVLQKREDGSYVLAADFAYGDEHENGGEFYQLSKSDIVFPAKKRDTILKHLKASDWESINKERSKLPKRLPEDKELQDGIDGDEEEVIPKEETTKPIEIGQLGGIKSFIKEAVTNQNVEYNDKISEEMFKKYDYDFDKIVDDIGKSYGIPEENLGAYRDDIYNQYGFVKPDVEQVAEINYLNTPVGYTESESGLDKYKQLQDDLMLAESMFSRLGESNAEYAQTDPGKDPNLFGVDDYEFTEGGVKLKPELRDKQLRSSLLDTRGKDIENRIESINKAMADQSKANMEEFGYASQEHQEVKDQFKKYDALYDKALNERDEKSSLGIGAGFMPTKYATYKDEAEKVKDLRSIKQIYGQMGKVLGSPQGKDFQEQWNGLLHGFSNNFFTKDFATLGLNEMGRLLNVKDAFDTYNKTKEQLSSENEYSDPAQLEVDIMKTMPQEQKALLDTYRLLLEVQAGTRQNFSVGIGEGLKEMIPFIAQFAATSGSSSAAKKAVTEFVETKTKSAIAGKISGAIAKPLIQGAMMIPANLQNYAERVAPTMNEQGELVEGEESLNAAYKAYLTTVAEVVGEDIGTFANKWANKSARNSFGKMIANNPNMAQKFLGKMSLLLTADTGVPSVQGFLFEGIGEEATGIMQAGIDQDGNFFTPEAQKQLWVMSLLASGGFASTSIPNRVKAKIGYNNSVKVLNDIPNQGYTEAVTNAAQNYTDPDQLIQALDEVSKQFDVSELDFNKARGFIGNTIRQNQMNASRQVRVDVQIAEFKDDNGNVTSTVIDGQPYTIRNSQDIGQPGKVIFAKGPDGVVKPILSNNIDPNTVKTLTPDEIKSDAINKQDQQDEVFQKQEQVREEAASRGIEEGNTVNTPHGKKTLVALTVDGTAIVEDQKGEQTSVNANEIDAYKTTDQKEAEKVEKEVAKQALQEPQVVSDEELVEGSNVRVIDYDNGQSKIVTPEGDQVFESAEQRDAAVKELVEAELQAAQEGQSIDDLPPEQAYKIMLEDDVDIANEIFQGEIEGVRAQAEESRTLAKESQSRSEKKELLAKAKQLDAEAVRLETILADPTIMDQVQEEAAAELPPEEQAELLYQEYNQELESAPFNQLAPWQQEALSSKVNRDSFMRYSDPNSVTKALARGWFTPKADVSSSNDVDAIAADLSETHGIEVTPQAIVDLMLQFPTRSDRKTTDRTSEIASAYKEIAGKSIKSHTTAPSTAEEITKVEDSPLGEKPDDVPFRVEENSNLDITDKAMNDIRDRQNAIKELNKLQEMFGIPIKVVNSSELTMEAKAKARRIGTPKAFYQDGVAYILSDQITSVSDVKKSYLHESILHKGLDLVFESGPVTLLGKSYETKNDLIDDVYSKMSDKSKQERANVYFPGTPLDQLTIDQQRELSEEVLATMNETESPSLQVFFDKLYNYIKKLLGFTNKQFSKADLRNMLREHRELIIANKPKSTEAKVGDGKTKFRTSEGQGFDEWKGDNKYVDDYQIGDVQTGEPIVAKVYHGTTHDITEFKGGEVGNIEGHLGKTNYFTSDYGDAEGNYGAEGADITGRIEQRKERLEQDLEELTIDEITDQFNPKWDEIYPEGIPEDINYAEVAENIAKNELIGGEEQVLELYAKLNNPLVLGNNSVYIDTIDEAEIESYLDDAAEEIAEEYEVDVDEAKEDYSSEIRDRAIENSGAEDRVVEAMRLALEGQDVYDKTLYEFLPEYYGGEVDLNQIDKDLRASEELMYIESEDGQLANNQIISDFYEELGYDGVILRDVSERFPNMGLSEYTSHIHIPDQYNNQIKLADGSNVDFGKTSDIRFRVADTQQELDDFVKDSKVKETVYHGTNAKFDDFDINRQELAKYGEGVYFTSDYNVAQEYADDKVDWESEEDPDPYVKEARIDIKNPLIYDSIESVPRDINTEDVKAQGYDGLIINDQYGEKIYVAYSNDQILIEPKDDVKFRVESPIVYHGSDQNIDKFDIDKAEGSSKASRNKSGIFFTSDPNFAKSWGENLNERKLELNKPLKEGNQDPLIKEIFGEDGFTGNIKAITNKKADKLKEAGYDGVIGWERWTNYTDGQRKKSDTYLMFSEDGIIKPSEAKVEEEREKVETNPSEAQKEAGNYTMGHVAFDGFDISIENPRGSIRAGINSDGEKWSNIMPADYGYFKGTVGNDKDHIDTFMGDNLESDKVYVVDQINADGSFDEHKVMLGYNSISEARNAYNEAYDEGWSGLGAITRTTKDGLKEWFKGDTKKPFAKKEDVKFRVQSDNPEVQKMLDKLQAIDKVSKAATKINQLEDESLRTMGVEREYIANQIKLIKEVSADEKADTKTMIKEVQKAIVDYAKKALPLTEAGAREIGPILTLLKDAQTPEAFEKAVDKIDMLAGVTTEKQQRRKYVSKVNRLLKWMTGLKKSGTKRVGKFNYEDTKAFQELKDIEKQTTDLIKLSNSRKATAEEKMEAETSLDQLWETINAKEDKSDMDNAMMKLVELRRLGSKASPELAQIVAEELEVLYEAAKDAKSEVDMDKAFRRKEDKEFIKDFLKNDKALVDKPWYKRAMSQVNSKVADIMGNWETIMTMVGGTKLRDKMSLMLHEANMETGKQETNNELLDKAKDAYGEKTKMGTLNKIHSLSDKKYELRKPNRMGEEGEGKPTQISKLELMDIYNAIKNENIENDYYLSYGDIAQAEDGSRDLEAQRENGKATIDALVNNLSEEDKAFADSMQEILDTYYEKMNAIHIKLYNRDLPRVENYWPSTVERVTDIDVMEQFTADVRYPGATKERTQRRTPEPRDAFNKFTKHVEEAEWFINMALPIQNANKLFQDKNVQNRIEDARGDKFFGQITDALQNVGLGKVNQSSELSKLLNPLLNNWVVAKIGATPSVPLKQLLSSVNYAENMPAGKWAKGFVKNLASPRDTWKEMMDIPYLKARIGDGYSEAVQRALNGDENIHQSKASNFHNAFKKWMTIGTSYGDIAAIIFGGKPYLDYLLEQDGMTEQEAVDKFLQDTLRSQQAPFSSTLSKLQNSRNPFLRAFFTFSNTPSQYMRKLFEANQNLRVQKSQFKAGKITQEEYNKAKKQTAKAHAIYGLINTVSFTMTGALVNAVMKGSDPEDEMMENISAQLAATYVGGLPIIKDILGTATRQTLGMRVYDDVNPYVEGLDGFITEAIKLSRGESKDKAKTYEKMGQFASDMLGVPFANIKKDIKAIPPFRDDTIKETRTKEVGYKLNDLSKDDSERTVEAAKDIKSAYSSAKRKAKELTGKGEIADAKRITRAIDKSKLRLWESDYTPSQMKRELEKFEDSLD